MDNSCIRYLQLRSKKGIQIMVKSLKVRISTCLVVVIKVDDWHVYSGQMSSNRKLIPFQREKR